MIALVVACFSVFFFFFKQKTAYEMRISDWSSDVCSSDLPGARSWRVDPGAGIGFHRGPARPDQRRSTPLCRARGDPARASGGPSPNLRLSLLFGAGRTGFARMDRSGSRGGDIE